MSKIEPAPVTPLAYSISEFCKAHGICTASYYALKKRGAGPREMRLPGNLIRISAEAVAEWRRRCENPSAADAEALARDAERRRERSRKAASKSVESPAHVSNRNRAA
jgi:predicted DNA-binding transcriptional regulator AlpA